MIVYHLYPQSLHLKVFLILELNNPKATPPVTLSVVDIFSILALPHVGHFAEDTLISFASQVYKTTFCAIRYFMSHVSPPIPSTDMSKPVYSNIKFDI